MMKLTAEKQAALPRLGDTQGLVDLAGIHGEFFLTDFGDLVAILAVQPCLQTTGVSSAGLMQAFAQVLHSLAPRLNLQFLQMPLPARLEALTDRYGTAAHTWKEAMFAAEAQGRSQDAAFYGVRLEAARLIAEDILLRTSSTACVQSFCIFTRRVNHLQGVHLEMEAEAFRLQITQAEALFANQGIPLAHLALAEALDVLWQAYNPQGLDGSLAGQAMARFGQVFESGVIPPPLRSGLSREQVELVLADPGVHLRRVLAPACLQEGRDCLTFHRRVLTPYYVSDFRGAVPSLQHLSGPGGRFAHQLLVSFYIESPSADEVAAATRRASTARQALQSVAARLGGTLPSYKQSEEVAAIEHARYGAETEKDVVKFLSLYLGLLSEAGQEQADQVEFEAHLKAIGVEFVPATWRARDIWQSMLPLGHRYHSFEGRNLRAGDIASLVPVQMRAWFDPAGQFMGYTALGPQTWMPVVVKRERGLELKPTEAFIGEPGSGKSYALKFHMLNWAALGERQFIIDPKGEFLALTEMLRGRVITLGGGGRGFNLLQFDRIEAPPRSMALHELSTLVWEDNLASLLTLYEGAKGDGTPASGVERRHFITALERAMQLRGMDPRDGRSWQPNQVFLSDVYQVLCEELGKEDPDSIRTMRLTLEPYATPGGRYYALFNAALALDLANDLNTITLGLSNLTQEKNLARLAVQFALKTASQAALRAFLTEGRAYKPYHILIDEASQIIVTPGSAASLARMLSLFPAYGISLHMAFQDFNAIYVADRLIRTAASDSANTISALIPGYWLFRQAFDSAARAGETLALTSDEVRMLPKSPPGSCILAFSGDMKLPLSIHAPADLHPYLCTQPEEGRRQILRRLSQTGGDADG